MATQTSAEVQDWSPVLESTYGNMLCRQVSYAVDAAQNDVIQMVKVPQGAIIVDGYLRVSGAAGLLVTADVGDGSDDDRFLAAADIDGTLFHRFNLATPFEYSAEDTIDITVEGADPASITYTLVIFYLVNSSG